MTSVRYVDYDYYDEDKKIRRPVAFIPLRNEVPYLEIYYPDGDYNKIEIAYSKYDPYWITENQLNELIRRAKIFFPKGQLYITRPLIKMSPWEQWNAAIEHLAGENEIFRYLEEEAREEHNKIHWDAETEEEMEEAFLQRSELYSLDPDDIEMFLIDCLGSGWKGLPNRQNR